VAEARPLFKSTWTQVSGFAMHAMVAAGLEHHPTEWDHPSDKDARENEG